MKLLKIVINGLPHFKDELNIDFVALQRVDEYDKERLCSVFSNIYVNKAISFVGINASGKTTILKAISFVMKMLNNESINNIQSRTILDDLDDNQQVTITTYFYDGHDVNKLETSIGKEVSDVDGSEKFIIRDEKLSPKIKRKI